MTVDRSSSWNKRRTPTYMSVLLGFGLAISCAEVSTPEDDGNTAATATGGAATGGQLMGSTGGGAVVVVGSGGVMMSMGGSSGGMVLVGGDGDGDMAGDGDGGVDRCEDDSDCAAMPGCNTCGLNSASFLFECMPDPEVTDCSGECVDLQTSDAHCGACGEPCTGDLTCNGGTCECPGAGTECDSSCVDLQTDVNNCGTCGEVCSGATPYCSNGECTECETPGETSCEGSCFDLQTDAANCGTCGNACNTAMGQICVAGTCEDRGNCAAPDVANYRDASCGTTAVYEGALYECISSNVGNCGPTGVYCQNIIPTDGHWGPQGWDFIMNCP